MTTLARPARMVSCVMVAGFVVFLCGANAFARGNRFNFTIDAAASSGRAAESVESLSLEVLMLDEVGVPGETLRQARNEASRIFESLGIGLVWIEGGNPKGRYIVIKIVSKQLCRIVSKQLCRKSRNPSVLGISASSNGNDATLAWLFYDRIADKHQQFDAELPLLLGHVMAHEMGHLLLPHGSHTQAGLMKAGWDINQIALASAQVLTFLPEQAATIRARLRLRRAEGRGLRD